MTVAATYEFDWREHYRASREVARRIWTRWLGWGFAALALVLALLNYRAAAGRASALSVFLNVLPWIVLGAVWLGMIPILQWRAARKLPSRDASVQGPQERIVDAAGYHSRGNSVALDIPWHAMMRGIETTDFFLFFYNKQCAYYFPKRVISTAQIESVRSLVREGLGDKAELL
jgi:YcxB-like protein